MDSKTIRQTKFSEIVRRAGGVTAFSNAYDGRWHTSLVHRWVTGVKGIGPKAARAIEERVGLPADALDQEGEIPPHVPVIPVKITAMQRPEPEVLIQAHEILARRGRYDLGTMAGAQAFAAAYEVVARTHAVTTPFDEMVSGLEGGEREQQGLQAQANSESETAAPARKVSTRRS